MASNLDKLFKTDVNLEKEGIWFDISEEVAFKMRRFGGANSMAVKAATAKYYKPFARQVDAGTLSVEKEKDIMLKSFVAASMLDWKGIEIDGKLADYSFDACVKLLGDLPELADTLIEYAKGFDSFKVDLGNS